MKLAPALPVEVGELRDFLSFPKRVGERTDDSLVRIGIFTVPRIVVAYVRGDCTEKAVDGAVAQKPHPMEFDFSDDFWSVGVSTRWILALADSLALLLAP
jgi:hypothetical protein